jgi:hypothetical protein
MAQILFGVSQPKSLQHPRFDQATNRLPVDMRVAILDYWEQREAILKLANGKVSTDLESRG